MTDGYDDRKLRSHFDRVYAVLVRGQKTFPELRPGITLEDLAAHVAEVQARLTIEQDRMRAELFRRAQAAADAP